MRGPSERISDRLETFLPTPKRDRKNSTYRRKTFLFSVLKMDVRQAHATQRAQRRQLSQRTKEPKEPEEVRNPRGPKSPKSPEKKEGYWNDVSDLMAGRLVGIRPYHFASVSLRRSKNLRDRPRLCTLAVLGVPFRGRQLWGTISRSILAKKSSGSKGLPKTSSAPERTASRTRSAVGLWSERITLGGL